MVENSEIPQVTNTQPQYTTEAPQLGEISPKQQEQEGHVSVTPKSGEIPPIQTDEGNLPHFKPNMNKISPKEPNEVTDLVANGRESKDKDTYSDSRKEYGPQGDKNLQQKSALGSNVSSLFNTMTFNTTHNEQKVTLDWILPDGKNSQLETLRDKHIVDCGFPSTRRKHGNNASVPAGPGTIL